MQVATCSFAEFRPEAGQIPVRASLGFPRYKLHYTIPQGAFVRDIAPSRAYWNEPFEEFQRQYWAQLDRRGLGAVSDQLHAIVEANHGDTAVVLCFENLTKKPFCHRTMFAAWWTGHTGDEVLELGAVPRRSGGTGEAPQATLL